MNANALSNKTETIVSSGDLAFMNEAAQGGLGEVEMGRLAAKQASNSDVKQFGQKMVDDHSNKKRCFLTKAPFFSFVNL